MNLFYCEKCHTLIREADITSGAAKLSGEEKYICAVCSGKASAPIPAFAANSTAHIKIPNLEKRESGVRPHAHSSAKGRPIAPDKKSGREQSAPATGNNMVPILGGVVGALVVLVLIFVFARGKSTPAKVDPVKNDPPKQVVVNDPPTTPPTPPVTPEPPINPDKPVPPPLDLPGTEKGPEGEESPRDRMARRELESIKNWGKDHGSDPFGYVGKLADFQARNRTNKFGQEAAKIMAEIKLPSRIDQTLARWTLDESDASFKGKAYITGGKVGRGAVVLSGADSDYVDLGSDPALNIAAGAPFTIAGWIRTSADTGMVLSFRNSKIEGSDLDIAVGNNGASTVAGALVVIVRQDGSSINYSKVVGPKVNDGSWHHFVLQRIPDGTVKLYVDGTFQVSHNGPEGRGALSSDMRSLGLELYWLRFKGNGQGFKGEIDDVRFYGIALSEPEIKELMNVK